MTILVTGAGGGLGRAIGTRLGAATITREDGDLSRMSEVHRLARQIAQRYPDLQVLINNAGTSRFTLQLTPEGLETTFATNYMAPYVLSNLLLPVLQRNRGTIVNVGSEQHRWVRAIPWEDMQCASRWKPVEQYSLTKLYLVMFSRELARRAPAITSVCVSPGFLQTNLGRYAVGGFRLFLALARPLQRSPEHGAEAVIHAMQSKASGAYFRGKQEIAPSKLALDRASAARLWELGARWLEPAQVG
jgi:NAD(P)-dependent dehydrogenase (short-subunit alcohol dehydrogenase family)